MPSGVRNRSTAALFTPPLAALLALLFAGPAPAASDDYAARMDHQHGGESPTPTPATVPEPAVPVTAEEVVYATLDGKPVKGYLARPKSAAAPGSPALPALLVIQEWWGLNDNIRAMTRRLAGEGYVALAVDLYEGELATDSAAAMSLMKASLEKSARLLDNLRQGHAYLRREAGASRVGVLGWCFGGAWSLETALALGDGIDAAVMYYGRVQTDPKALAALKAPLLGLFGGKDQGIPVDAVRQMEQALAGLGKDATIVVYPDADHAFANPSGARYDAAAATDAWAKTTAFLARHLKR
jgi:carboxymethylenebutenolidase